MDYQHYLSRYEDVSRSGFVVAGDDYSAAALTIIAALADHDVYVQKLEIIITTQDNSSVTLKDTASTPKIAWTHAANPAAGTQYSADWGLRGLKLTSEKGLVLASSAAGLAFSWSVQAYRRPADAQVVVSP